MKNLKLFIAMIIGIIAITSTSCKKDDDLVSVIEPNPTLIVGQALDSILFIICQQSALNVIQTYKVDTIWLTLEDSITPLLDGDGNQLFKTEVVTVTLLSEMDWIKAKTKEIFDSEKDRIVEYFNTHEAKKTIIGYPDSLDTKIIYRLDASNKSFVNMVENGFNTLGERMRKSPEKPLSQLVSEGIDPGLIPTQNAVLATLDDELDKLLP